MKLRIDRSKISSKMDFFISKALKIKARNFIKKVNPNNKAIIGIHASTGSMYFKRWPAEKFSALIRKLSIKYKVIVFKESSDDKYSNEIIKGSPDNIIIVQEDLRFAVAIASLCNTLVCNDSGFARLAFSMGTPLFIISGPVLPWFTQPYPKGFVVIRKKLWCSPCYDITRVFRCRNPNKFECLKKITPDDVLSAIEKSGFLH